MASHRGRSDTSSPIIPPSTILTTSQPFTFWPNVLCAKSENKETCLNYLEAGESIDLYIQHKQHLLCNIIPHCQFTLPNSEELFVQHLPQSCSWPGAKKSPFPDIRAPFLLLDWFCDNDHLDLKSPFGCQYIKSQVSFILCMANVTPGAMYSMVS